MTAWIGQLSGAGLTQQVEEIINMPTGAFLAASSLDIMLSPSIAADVLDGLVYLTGYPYLARATKAGSFHAPPAQVYLMYEPEFWGRSASSELSVTIERDAVDRHEAQGPTSFDMIDIDAR